VSFIIGMFVGVAIGFFIGHADGLKWGKRIWREE
jgi:hypothetical protein